VLRGLIDQHSFGTLVSQLEGQLFATHLPLLFDPSRGPNGTLLGHMARANPHWHAFADTTGPDTLAIFTGPHAYISPSWYASEEAVPTWNYSAVHAYGRPTVTEDADQVRALLDKTVTTFESGLPDQWTTGRVSDEYIANMARAIVAFEMPIARLEGKRKLSQNRPVADAEGAAAGLLAHGDDVEKAVAEQMLDVVRSR
jgi:transcriptional regulator